MIVITTLAGIIAVLIASSLLFGLMATLISGTFIFGIITAVIAHYRGRNVIGWFLFGTILFIVALPLILLLPRKSKKCPHCKETIQKEANVCRHCKSQLEK
jgi:hypothetical protein